jgi:Ca2+-binding RTX toxin-like protein
MNARPRHACKPTVEALEDRQLLAGNVYVSSGYLAILGTSGNDYVYVSDYGSQIAVSFNGQSTRYFSRSSITTGWIYFLGYAGNDYFSHDTNLKCAAWGGPGNDTLNGSDRGTDYLFGDDGNDMLFGKGGSDYLVGGSGNDSLYGGAGSDVLYGESGDDYLDHGGDWDRDWLYGGYGRDSYSRGSNDIVSDPDTTVRAFASSAAQPPGTGQRTLVSSLLSTLSNLDRKKSLVPVGR